MAREGGSYRGNDGETRNSGTAYKAPAPVVKTGPSPEEIAKKKIQDETNAIQDRDKKLNDQLQGQISTYKNERNPLYERMNANDETFTNQQKGLLSEADENRSSVNTSYKNLSSKMDNFVNQAEAESQKAMTLDQLADPANSAAFKNNRQLFEDQAQGENNQGLANYGVLSSLGAQAFQGQQNGMPMTVGQQQAMASMSQRQAGEAFANTQRRIQGLRDQGLQTGLNAHQNQYNMGQQAKGLFQNSVSQKQNLDTGYTGLLQGLRGEATGYQGNINQLQNGIQSRMLGRAQEDYGLATGNVKDVNARAAGISNLKIGQSQAELGQIANQQQMEAQRAAAESAADAQKTAAMIQAGGTVLGAGIGAFGGPMGMAAGAAVGGGLAGGVNAANAPSSSYSPQASNYNLGVQQPAYKPYAGKYSLSQGMQG